MKFQDILKAFSSKKLPQSEVELAGDIPFEALLPYRDQALAHIAQELELPGFRKGFVPKDMAQKRVGELAVLEEAVELLVRDFYPELIEEKKLDVVGRPSIQITKLAPNNPVSLTIRTALYPEIELPDWKKLAGKIPAEIPAPIEEKEVEETLENLRKNRATTDAEGAAQLPELNDEFAKSLGAFESLENLKAEIRKGITEEKIRAAKDKRRVALIDGLLEKTKIEMPAIFVESELEKILAQMKDDVARFGMQYEEYLKRSGKTEEKLREEFRSQAEKRAKLQLTLNKIAEDEKIEPEESAVEEEVKHGLEHFPGAKPELLRIHVRTVLRNEKVLEALEGGGRD